MRRPGRTEGGFAGTGGGLTGGVADARIAAGRIPGDDSAVHCIAGHGLEALGAVVGHVGQTRDIRPSLREFEALLEAEKSTVAA